MRFLHRNTPRHSDEALSAASSTLSTDSYEVFGSACSDYSECDYCEDRRQRRSRRNTTSTQSPGTSHSYRSAMDHNPQLTESAPLLNTVPSHAQYSSVSDSDSLGPADLSTKAILATYRELENQKKPERKKQSSLVTIFSIWNTTLGSSLLTMAWGVERAGLLTGLLLLIVMGGLCLFTAGLLLSVNRHHGGATCEVPLLCRTLLGPWAEKLAHTFSLLVLLGANVVYWILITNFLYYTVNYFMDITSGATYNATISCASNASILSPPAQDAPAAPALWRLHATVPLYVAAIIFPLLNFRNATFFTKFNSLGTLSVFYLLLFVTIKGWVWGINFDRSLITAHAGKEAAVLSGMLALSFYIHNILITIMNNNENQDNNGRDLTIAFVLITLTYMLVGCVFYVCFPLIKTCIEDNILNNFEMHDVMTAVARMLLLFQVITVFPLVAFMLRTEAILLLPLSEELKTKRRTTILVNIVIVLICILFACFCPNIGTIIRYTGAAGGLIHIFTLPSLLQLRSLQLRGKLTCWKTVLYCSILLVGPVNLLLQFIVDE